MNERRGMVSTALRGLSCLDTRKADLAIVGEEATYYLQKPLNHQSLHKGQVTGEKFRARSVGTVAAQEGQQSAFVAE